MGRRQQGVGKSKEAAPPSVPAHAEVNRSSSTAPAQGAALRGTGLSRSQHDGASLLTVQYASHCVSDILQLAW